jgi:cytochrome P450
MALPLLTGLSEAPLGVTGAFNMMLWMLLVAGSGASIHNSMFLLVQHPEQTKTLRSNDSLLPNFVEEAL